MSNSEPCNKNLFLDPQVDSKRAASTTEDSPAKKIKLINDGFCVFVGNLNNHKKAEELFNALAQFFTAQSLLFQSIRLDRSKKHAHVDLVSEMDMTKALKLNGEMMLDKPIKVEKAKIKSAEKATLSNIPYDTTKEDLLKLFKAVDVRFPGGTDGPKKGTAFLEFKKPSTVKKIMRKKPEIKIQGKAQKQKAKRRQKVSPASPNNTLFVSNLPYRVKEATLKTVFKKAVSIALPEVNGKKTGFAFIEFATVADAQKALESAQNKKLRKREIRAEFCRTQKADLGEELTKTLIITGLDEKTTAETLKNAFDGAVSARVIVNKKTSASKRFGFVDFESDEVCKEAKKAMEDCQIDGCNVSVAYARAKVERNPSAAADQNTTGTNPIQTQLKREGSKSSCSSGGGAAFLTCPLLWPGATPSFAAY
uniref:RRM domain-containing protein n=1 Tax=Takifugu rubripes TaxID=31033 RepID=A0A3B5KLZ7_TAKRU